MISVCYLSQVRPSTFSLHIQVPSTGLHLAKLSKLPMGLHPHGLFNKGYLDKMTKHKCLWLFCNAKFLSLKKKIFLILQQDESYVTCWSNLLFVIFIIKTVSNSTILVHKLPASRLSKVKVVVFTPITLVPSDSWLTLTATTSITLKILRTYNWTTN